MVLTYLFSFERHCYNHQAVAAPDKEAAAFNFAYQILRF
jgi:hypothetical protein